MFSQNFGIFLEKWLTNMKSKKVDFIKKNIVPSGVGTNFLDFQYTLEFL